MLKGIILVEGTVRMLLLSPKAQSCDRPSADIRIAIIGTRLQGQDGEQRQGQRTLLQDDRSEIADFKVPVAAVEATVGKRVGVAILLAQNSRYLPEDESCF